jgi:hypothetical protein
MPELPTPKNSMRLAVRPASAPAPRWPARWPGAGFVAVLQEGRHRVVDHLDHDVAGLVVLVHAAVHEGHAFVDAAGQLELEVGQAVVAHAAAEAHHRGLADMRAVGQLAHRQLGKGARVGQQQLGHPLFGRGSEGRAARMRSSMGKVFSGVGVTLLGPAKAVARDHGAGGGWAPRCRLA